MLTTIGRLEKLAGTLSSEEQDSAEILIELVSAHIANRTGMAFEQHTEKTIRRQAAWDGRISLPRPTTAVHSVKVWDSGVSAPHWRWDGHNTIFNLRGWETVDITLDYGLDEVPKEIELVALLASYELFRSEIRGEPGSLQEFQVGDVREKFASGELDPESVFTQSQKELLDSYAEEMWTQRVGLYVPPAHPSTLHPFQSGG